MSKNTAKKLSKKKTKESHAYEKQFSALKKKYVDSCKEYYICLEKVKKVDSEREEILRDIRELQIKFKDSINLDKLNSFNEDDFNSEPKNLIQKYKQKIKTKVKKTIKDTSDSNDSSE